jgi:hypothetical protein
MNLTRRKLQFSDDEEQHDDSSTTTPKHCSKCVTSAPSLQSPHPSSATINTPKPPSSHSQPSNLPPQKPKLFVPLSMNSNKYASGRFENSVKPINNFNQTWTKPMNESTKIIKKNTSNPVDLTKIKPNYKRTFIDNLPLIAMGAAAAGLVGYETYKWLKGKQKFDVGTQKDKEITQDDRDLARLMDVYEQERTPEMRAQLARDKREINERMDRLRARGVEFDPVVEPLLSELKEMEDGYDHGSPPDDLPRIKGGLGLDERFKKNKEVIKQIRAIKPVEEPPPEATPEDDPFDEFFDDE